MFSLILRMWSISNLNLNSKIYSYSLEGIEKFVEKIKPSLVNKKFFLFDGPMGSGKTTLIRELIKTKIDINEFCSPTYSILNVYNSINKNLGPVMHLDFYRIKSEEDLESTGFWDEINKASLCFIEWASNIKNITHKLNEPLVFFNFENKIHEERIRKLTIEFLN